MHADLDTLCTAVYCTADDLLPARVGQRPPASHRCRGRHPRASPRRSWASPPTGAFSPWPGKRLRHLFPELPAPARLPQAPPPPGRDDRVAVGVFAAASARASTTTSCCSTRPPSSAGARSRPCAAPRWPTAAATATAASHSRFFWGMRLHLAFAPDGTPRAAALVAADRPEREVALALLPRALRGGEAWSADKGYAGRDFARRRGRARRGPACAPARRTSPAAAPTCRSIRQRIESVFQTAQGPAHARAPRRPHARGPPRPHRRAPAGARRLRLRSTTGSAVRAARSWPSSPERVESVI